MILIAELHPIALMAVGLLASGCATVLAGWLEYVVMLDGGCERQLNGITLCREWTLNGKFLGEREIRPPPPPVRNADKQ